jgi:hypothetical protein
MQEEAAAMVSTTQHHGENCASIWRKLARSIRSIFAPMHLPVLALLVGISLCRTAAGQTATAINLGVSSGAITVGASETLTATVMSGGLPVTAGSVEFRDNLASPGGSVLGKTPLNGSGSGQLILSSVGHGVHLGMGLHEISAIYTGSSGLAVSVSAYQAVTVSGTSQLPTTTAISSTGVAGNYMLTGTVSALTPVLPTGIVSFLDTSNGNAVLATQTLDPTSKSFGLASFSTASALSGVTSVAVGDFNGDGNLDLAVANTYSGTVSILLGDGAGNFLPAATPTVRVGYYPNSIAVGDFNNDGNLDLAVANYASGTVSILLGDGTGNFTAGATPAVGNSPYSIAAGDFLGNGNLDLAVANSGDGTVSILLGDGTGNFTVAATVTVGSSPHSVVAGDFLGNGNLDLAVANSGDGTVSILKGDGTGNFTGLPNSPVTVERTPNSVAVGDFNGDGVLDLAVANECGDDPRCASPGSVSILLGDGAGNFSAAATSPVPVGVNPWSVAVGDFNSDGNLDLAVANFTNGTVSVLLGDGAGNFSTATALPVSVGVKPESVAVGDFNGDGNPDMAVANYTDGTVSVLHAVWTESASAPVIFSTPASHNVLASYPGDSIYTSSQSTSMPLLGLLNTGLVWTPVDTIIYGTTLSALLNATTTYGGAPVPSTCSYTATPSGGSAFAVDSSTVLNVGPYTLGVSCTGLYPAATGTAPLTVYATGYVLTTGANHPLRGTVTPATGNIYSPTVQVAITATANPGYTFAGWLANADISNISSANTTVTMNSAETVTADFETVPSFVVNTPVDDSSTPAASNCPANPSGTGSGPCTLRDALLAAASAGGNISFDPTVFSASNTAAANTITLGVDGTLTIPTNTILTGATTGSGATLTNLVTVNGASASTVFTLSGGTVAILNNLTIENGTSGGNGGGISNSGRLTVNESTFTGNSANNGGAIDSSGTVTVSGSTFYNNSGTSGGGAIDDTQGGSLAVTGSTFYGNNSTTNTGGIAVSHSSFWMSNTIATGNGTADCTVYRSSCPANGTGGNLVGVPANLAAPGNYGGPTETMIPLPGSAAICAIVPTGTGTDQRGVAWPVSYSGTSCQDTGAVQTDYSLNFVQQPSTTLSLTPISPAPTVELQESGIPFASSVTIPLTLKDSSGDDTTGLDLSGGSVATSGGVATYSPLDVDAAGTGDTLTANLMLNSASNPATAISSTSNPFDVILKPTTTVSSDALATYSASVQSIPLSATVTSSMGTVNAGTVTFTVMQGGTTVGTPVSSGTVSSGAASANYSLPGGTTAGMYTVQATYNSSGGGFAVSSDSSHTLTVGMATATITLGGLSQIYTGSPLAATATTVPSGLTVNLTYNGSSTAPTAVGSYAVVGTISDSNYQGSSSSTLVIGKDMPAITWAAPAAIVYGTALSAAQLDAGSTVAGTFVYTPAAGVVPTAGLQTLSVTFTPTDSSDYSTATATVQLTVNKAAPVVTWAAPTAIAYGTALSAAQLDASSTVAGTFVYTPAAGVVPTAGSQTLSVTFTPTDSSDYSTATATVQLTVNKATPAITWAAPAAIAYGTALSAAQLDANSTVAGTFVYTPAAGVVPMAGLQTLSVTFTPTDSSDYSTATSTVQLTVNKATPVVTWAAPATIVYGTALSAAQLDASSTVAGTFVYTPAAGAMLMAGPQTLSVTFTPTDSSDYSTATATVQLTANKAAPTITWAAPAAIVYGTALSAAQLDASSTVAGTFVYTPAAGVVPTAGLQTLSVTFTPTDSSDYSTATATVQLTVNTIPQTISFTSPSPLTYGSAPITLTATGGASGNPILFSISSGPGSITGSTLTINGAGSVVVAANQAGNASYAAATQVTQSIVVNPALTAIAVASSASTALAQNAVTLTATVSSPAGIPTGTVTFLDGTTPLGPGTLSGGVATLTTTSLAVGTHSISAVYSGGTNFVAATSAALTQCVMDFSLSAGGTSQTVTAGGSAVYSLAIAPSSGTSFPVAVTLTVSGLPATATASVTPAAWALSSNNPWTWTLPANTPLTSNSQLTIQMPQSLAQTQPNGAAGGNLASRLAPFSLALVILPFAGRMRRAAKRLRHAAFMLLLLIAGMAGMAGLSGCGSPSIFFTQQPQSYPLTVTVSAGTLSHSMPVTLVVE